jgi:hypothetical protein
MISLLLERRMLRPFVDSALSVGSVIGGAVRLPALVRCAKQDSVTLQVRRLSRRVDWHGSGKRRIRLTRAWLR